LRVRAQQLKRHLTTDEQSIRVMEVDKIMRKLAQKWAKKTRHAAKFATFTRWCVFFERGFLLHCWQLNVAWTSLRVQVGGNLVEVV
jgi:hypothetical protein